MDDANKTVASQLGLAPGSGGSIEVMLARVEGGIVQLAERLDARHDTLATAVEATRREGATANELLKTVLMARMDTDRVDLNRLRSDFDELKGKVEAERVAAQQREQREREVAQTKEQREKEIADSRQAERSNVRLSGVYIPVLLAVASIAALIVSQLLH